MGINSTLHLDRAFYIPKHARPIDPAGTDAAVYVYEVNGQLYALGFHGRAQRPDWHHKFRNEDSRGQHIANFIQARADRARSMATIKIRRQQPHTLKVGELLSTSWGYEQTNVEFFQVVAVPSPHFVLLRQIASQMTGDGVGPMAGYCIGVRDQFVGEPTKHKVVEDAIRFASYRSAHRWDGRPKYVSWYA